MRILIADDNKIALTVLRFALAANGFEVVAVENGRLALDSLRAGPCPLVITDWEMPEMDGLELCKSIRADAALAGTYIILLSGRNTPEERGAAQAAGANDFVIKPFEPVQLLARVREAERVLAQKA